ncbi:hypothetical protein AB4156_15980 [Cupriavidus sp. 2MCAB6]|uniref:hypothetical protein n=1 Tax=Cupriavidus sp. 2MCAB6 TaxID=3232981 RepID=UPI003F8F20F4
MLTVMVLLVFALVMRALYLHLHFAREELVRREEKGMLTCEVRRHVGMEVLPSHVSEYPVPREVRIRVVRFTVIVLWRKEYHIALPADACTHLGDISADETDERFPAWVQHRPS